jgi:hypothetical protein
MYRLSSWVWMGCAVGIWYATPIGLWLPVIVGVWVFYLRGDKVEASTTPQNSSGVSQSAWVPAENQQEDSTYFHHSDPDLVGWAQRDADEQAEQDRFWDESREAEDAKNDWHDRA